MKIEKINDHQIRCTLTKADLEDRQIRLSELAYGTEKAKNLFRDMMQQANSQFGFEADNIPLMIEAIPVSADSIILIITKVEDPEELDTRFSKFTPFSASGSEAASVLPQIEGADDILDIFQKIHDARSKAASKKKDAKNAAASDEAEMQIQLIRQFLFRDLDAVIRAAKGLNNFFNARKWTISLTTLKILQRNFMFLFSISQTVLRLILTKSAICFLNMEAGMLFLWLEKHLFWNMENASSPKMHCSN